MRGDRPCRQLAAAISLSLLLTAVGMAGWANPVAASDNGSWSVDPGGRSGPGARSFFVYTLKAGQAFQDTVTIANISDEPLTLDLYPTDAYNTSLDGGFALLAEDEAPVDTGSWIRLATDQITLEPGTQAEVPFEITIPDDAEPGDHAGGIVAQNVESEAQVGDDGVGVEVRRRVAARVYVRVDGPLRAGLQVTQIAADYDAPGLRPFQAGGSAVVAFEVKNTGNTRLLPTAELAVKGFFGRSIMRFADRELNELLPGSAVVVTERFDNLPPLERLTAEVTVTGLDSQGGEPVVAKGSHAVWVVSWPFVAALLLAALLLWGWRRFHRRSQSPGPAGPPKSAERELVSA